MPAKNLLRVSKEGAYSHVFNSGVESRVLFNEAADYQVFLGYLNEYLSPAPDPGSIRKSFTVKGKVYNGTPHQPKNYFNEIELVAYGLEPNEFHLVLRQITANSQANFLRSLCTRYSIYYNKKYAHQGSVFNGPYKSIQIDTTELPKITSLIHTFEYTSYPEYLGQRNTPWVKPKEVLAQVPDYEKTFKTYQAEKIPVSTGESLKVVTPRSRVAEFVMGASAIFIILFTLGARNVSVSIAKTQEAYLALASPSPTPATQDVAGIEDVKAEPKPKIRLAEDTNLYLLPSTTSEIVETANNGDIYEFVSEDSGWYRVLLEDGTAYLPTNYAQVTNEEL